MTVSYEENNMDMKETTYKETKNENTGLKEGYSIFENSAPSVQYPLTITDSEIVELKNELKADYNIEIEQCDFSLQDVEDKVIPIDKEIASCLAPISQALPSLATNAVALDTAGIPLFTVKFDGNLLEMKDLYIKNNGHAISNLSGEGSHWGKQADLDQINPAKLQGAAIASSAFAVASVVTSTYYLKNITDAINDLKQDTKDILSFLNHDKQSRMEANFETLKSIYNLLETIKKDKNLAEIKMNQLGRIEQDFAQDIKFYGKQVTADLNEYISAHRKKKNEYKSLNKMKNDINYQKWCIVAYSLSRLVEIAITENYSKEYIDSIRAELVKNQEDFRKECEPIASKVYIHNSTRINNVLKSEVADVLLVASALAEMTPLSKLNVDDAIENKSDKINDAIHKQSSKLSQSVKAGLEDNINKSYIDKLDLMSAFYNKPLEILSDGEDYYLKYDSE